LLRIETRNQTQFPESTNYRYCSVPHRCYAKKRKPITERGAEQCPSN
jgi:hypothetical protein